MRRGRTCLLLGAIVAAGSLLAPARVAASAYPLAFAPPQEFQLIESYPTAVGIGDVTGDRRKDVVMSTGSWSNPQYDWKVLVYRQLPNGTLAASPEAFSPIWKVAVHGVAVGDVTGDHRDDVVLATDLGVNVFRQRGGKLSRPFVVPRTVGAYSVELADMNRDGRKDIVVRGGTWVRVARSLRRGFHTSNATGGRQADVAAGDVNGDGRPDLVTAGYNGRLRVYRQRINGSFRRARLPRATRGASAVEVVDMTHDGRLDIAVTSGGFVHVLAQTKKGRLVAAPGTPGIDYPGALEALDMSGDGREDLIVRGAESVGVVLQDARATLQGFDLYLTGRPLSRDPNAVAAGDVTGDGRPDIAVAGSLMRGLFLFRQLPRPPRPDPPVPPQGPPPIPAAPPPGPLRFKPIKQYPLERVASSILIGDISDDRRNDVLVGTGGDSQTDGRLYGYLQEGDGSLRSPFSFGADAGGRVQAIGIGDIDGDGDGDAATAGYPGVGLYTEHSRRLASEPWLVPGTWGASRVAIVDFDGNRRKDLLFTRRTYSPAGLFVARNRGRSFSVSRVLKDSLFVDFADVTGDGRSDVVSMFGSTGSLTIYRRLPRGGFARPTTYTLNHPFPSSAGVGDVTGDGRNDLVVSGDQGWPASTLMVMAQNRAGTLDPPISMPAMENSRYLLVRDMNRDGRQDVVVFHDGRVGVFLQRPGGGLLPESLYAMATGGPSAVGDVDGDGLPDIVVAVWNYGTSSSLYVLSQSGG